MVVRRAAGKSFATEYTIPSVIERSPLPSEILQLALLPPLLGQLIFSSLRKERRYGHQLHGLLVVDSPSNLAERGKGTC